MVCDAQKLFRKYPKKKIGRTTPTYPKAIMEQIKESMGKFEMVYSEKREVNQTPLWENKERGFGILAYTEMWAISATKAF